MEIDANKARKEIEMALSNNSSAILLFRFLASRQRSAPITDISQLLSYMRKSFGQDVQRQDIEELLTTLTNLGFCVVRGSDGREKIYWNYWLFPILSSDESALLGLEYKPLKALKRDKTLFRSVKQQVNLYRTNLIAGSPQPDLRPDLVFNAQRVTAQVRSTIADFTTDEILAEMERRGFKIQMNVTK